MSFRAAIVLILGSLAIASDGFMTGGGPPYRINYQKVGCFKDDHKDPRPFLLLIGDFRDTVAEIGLNKTIWTCALIAKLKGFKYFGLQSYGQCWSGSNTFGRKGRSNQCMNGVGLSKASYVYKLVKQHRLRSLGARVRLAGGRTSHDGRVEIMIRGGEWGTVCGNGWDMRDANVVCRMLRFNGALLAGGISVSPGKGPIMMDQVACEGHEKSIVNCRSVIPNQNTSQRCRHPAVIVCRAKPSFPGEIRVPVRLVSGKSRHEGRIEVFYQRAWGTVCDEDWDLDDADVVCRSLGFQGALAAPGHAKYGEGKGQIWLTRVNCTGKELLVHNCAHERWGETACTHESDAGVQCRTGSGRS